jgi:cytochrome c
MFSNYRRRLLPLLVAAGLLVAVSAVSAQTGSKGQPLSKASDSESSGKGIYQQRCASCHFSDSTAQKIGPGLKGLYARGIFADGKKVEDSSMAKWIELGGKNMPGFKDALKPEQVRTLILYVKTL